MFTILNATISAMALLLATPSILILISWNTIPGDFLYTFKRGLEATVLAASGQTPVARRLKVEFVNRRFIESDRLLTEKKSIEGFKMAVSETKEATQQIITAQDSGAAEKLVENITQYQEKLTERKRQIITQEIAVTTKPVETPRTNIAQSRPTPTLKTPPPAAPPLTTSPVEISPHQASASPSPVSTAPIQEPIIIPPTPSQTEQKDQAIKEIEQTQKELEKVAKDLEDKVHHEKREEMERKEEGRSEQNRTEEKGREGQKKDKE